ncbi:hypothetical protein GCM10027290_62220 [Micromonospora sonneratiae]|uniref:WXG100 family type VII secretion target n=1 Tax=Micromonospora sonneratiae TaxID=1184706 RepID=A0ABW3YG01_9ACTN
MSDVTSTVLNSDAAGSGVKKLVDATDSKTVSNITQLVDRIRTIGEGRPWGGDRAGDAFDGKYRPANTALDATMPLMQHLESMATNLEAAFNRTITEDQVTQALIDRAAPIHDLPDLKF